MSAGRDRSDAPVPTNRSTLPGVEANGSGDVGSVHYRCHGSEACEEVLDRLLAADTARSLGLDNGAARLRLNAQRIADVHRAEKAEADR